MKRNVDNSNMVTVEFYGVPRQRAGLSELAVPAGSLADVLAAIEESCPKLAGLVGRQGRLAPQYLLSLNGDEFVSDMEQRIRPGDRVLLLSADAGG
ncbi:MAG: MoaD/ThiS family protein [Gemmataceae bacterium]